MTRRILLTPHLTEKSSALAERRQYTFLVPLHAEKGSVAAAVAERYGVRPVRVAIVRTIGKTVRYGRSVGRRSATKKAIVTLPEGKSIPFGVKT